MTNEGRTALARAEFDLAQEFLTRAQHDHDGGFHRGAVSAAYYAAFHAARGALGTLGVEARSQEGIQQLFALHFVKAGRFPVADGRLLRRMQKDRQDADYAVYETFELQDSVEAIENAKGLLQRASALLV